MEGEAPQPTEEEKEADRIETAIDRIGEEIKKYLLESTQVVVRKSEEFLTKYGVKPEYEGFLTEENITALIISSINNGIADLGILCKSHVPHDPIRVFTGANIVTQRLRRHRQLPQSPTKMTASNRDKYYMRPAKGPPSPLRKGAKGQLNFGPGGERHITFSQTAGNRTRRNRKRR